MQFKKKEKSDKVLKVRLTEKEKEYIKQIAEEKGITITDLVKEALNIYSKEK